MKSVLKTFSVFLCTAVTAMSLLTSCDRQPETSGESGGAESEAYMRETSQGYITVIPGTTDEALYKNPGKGWILYDSNGNFASQTAKTWAIASVAYIRYNWCEIETADGVYAFDVIDANIAEAQAHGCRLAFGIMACNPSSATEYCTPRFILERDDVNSVSATATGIGAKIKTINFNDPGEGYFLKVEQLVKALAERYGDSGDIEYIDIRSYGSWGENTFSQLEDSEGIFATTRYDGGMDTGIMKRVWKIYIDAFRDTGIRLMTAWGAGCNGCESYNIKELFYWAAEQGVGVRRDGFGDANNCKACEALWSYNKAPAVLEMPGGYAGVKDGGFDGEDLLAAPYVNHASYYPLGAYGKDGANMLVDLKDEIETVTNQIGYHFTLAEASFSASLGIGETATIAMKWLNDGSARLFLDSSVTLALLDAENNVLDTCVLEGVDPTKWVSGCEFPTDDKANREYAAFFFDVSPAVPVKLAIGLSTSYSDEPNIKIGNTGATDSLWYVLYDETEKQAPEIDFVRGNAVSVTASSCAQNSTADAVKDGSKSFWSAADDGAQSITIEFDAVREISCLTLDWGICYASDFTVSVSENGDTWVKVFENSGKFTSECVFDAVNAKYVRLDASAYASRETTFGGVLPYTDINIIRDGGFDDGAGEWTGESNNVVFSDGNVSISGTKSATIKHQMLQQFEITGPGEYEISFDALNSGESLTLNAVLGIRWPDEATASVAWFGPSKRLIGTVKPTVSDEWTHYSVTIDAAWESTIEVAYLELTALSGKGVNLKLDNVSIVKKGEINGERSELYDDGQSNMTLYSVSAK